MRRGEKREATRGQPKKTERSHIPHTARALFWRLAVGGAPRSPGCGGAGDGGRPDVGAPRSGSSGSSPSSSSSQQPHHRSPSSPSSSPPAAPAAPAAPAPAAPAAQAAPAASAAFKSWFLLFTPKTALLPTANPPARSVSFGSKLQLGLHRL
jgi:hypothetical protein